MGRVLLITVGVMVLLLTLGYIVHETSVYPSTLGHKKVDVVIEFESTNELNNNHIGEQSTNRSTSTRTTFSEHPLHAACRHIDKLQRDTMPADVCSSFLVRKAPLRFLSTEKIAQKYGLTNLLLVVAAMMAYAAMDEREIIFPQLSPIDVEQLLDLNATQQLLFPVGVVFATRESVAPMHLKAVKARRLGFSMGNRLTIGSTVRNVAQGALKNIELVMNATKNVTFLVQRDFFLSFPFAATFPFDVCFYLRRIVFSHKIREQAKGLLVALANKGVRRFLALHLRLELDAKLVFRHADRVNVEQLRDFIQQTVNPLVSSKNIDAIYVCAGQLKLGFTNALRNYSVVPVFFKSDFPYLNIEITRTMVTSHEGAAVDQTVMEHSDIAVSASMSTFGLGVFSRRCKSRVSRQLLRRFAASSLLKLTNDSKLDDPIDDGWLKDGMLLYSFVLVGNVAKFTPLQWVQCGAAYGAHCGVPT